MVSQYDYDVIAHIQALERKVSGITIPQPQHRLVTAWQNAVSEMQMLPGLVGLWTGGGFGVTADPFGICTDQSGGGQYLIGVNSPELSHGNNGVVPFQSHTRANSEKFYNSLDRSFWITGIDSTVEASIRGLTFGGWFRLDSLANKMGLMGKYEGTGNKRSYVLLYDNADSKWTIMISDNGTAVTDSNDHPDLPIIDTWYHVVGRYTPGSLLDIFADGVISTSATGDLSLHQNLSAFTVGSYETGGTTYYLDGDWSMAWVCACILPDEMIQRIYRTQRILYDF